MNEILLNSFLFIANCAKQSKINIFYLLGLVIFILRIVVPIALLIWGIIDLIKVITTDSNLKSGGDPASTEMKKIIKRLGQKFVFAAAVFILPTLVSLLLNITSRNSDKASIEGICLLNATSTRCKGKVNFKYITDPLVCFDESSDDNVDEEVTKCTTAIKFVGDITEQTYAESLDSKSCSDSFNFYGFDNLKDKNGQNLSNIEYIIYSYNNCFNDLESEWTLEKYGIIDATHPLTIRYNETQRCKYNIIVNGPIKVYVNFSLPDYSGSRFIKCYDDSFKPESERIKYNFCYGVYSSEKGLPKKVSFFKHNPDGTLIPYEYAFKKNCIDFCPSQRQDEIGEITEWER